MKAKFRLSKLAINEDGTPSGEVLFFIEGCLFSDIVVGSSVCVFKTNKNGNEEYGYFYTSLVMEMTKDGFMTMNSLYKVEKIN